MEMWNGWIFFGQKFLRSVRNVRGGRRVSSGVRVTPRKRVRLVEWAKTVGSYLCSLEVWWMCLVCHGMILFLSLFFLSSFLMEVYKLETLNLNGKNKILNVIFLQVTHTDVDNAVDWGLEGVLTSYAVVPIGVQGLQSYLRQSWRLVWFHRSL